MKILKVLGKGYAGKVYLTFVKDDPSQMAAIQIFYLFRHADRRRKNFCTEVATMQQSDHSTLAQCYTAVKCQDYLVYSMPFYDHGDLIQLENENGKPFDTKIITNSILHVAIAVEYLHKHYLAHNDIKPENEFVDNWGYVHMGDVVFVRQMNAETRTVRARDLRGTSTTHTTE
ncbi:serine/threonine-protein kinase greatwall [Elysia marginata]|uniref:Serine/threonine-protein kinase greatwall n=1 Tax=Elysia marginata TaxID=1093978 RepID=A0AAV4JCM0_9GAST|nr:serine/threonine-protein kinase greatwall [Elysia marginata]